MHKIDASDGRGENRVLSLIMNLSLMRCIEVTFYEIKLLCLCCTRIGESMYIDTLCDWSVVRGKAASIVPCSRMPPDYDIDMY